MPFIASSLFDRAFMKKRIAVLGATGSIGKNTLDVIKSNQDFFEVVLLSSHSKSEELLQLKKNFPLAKFVLSGKKQSDRNIDFYETSGLLQAIKECSADIVVNGVAGAAGLEPSLAALETGARLALANKETIVMASDLAFKTAEKYNTKIIPVDSEHSAVFSLIQAHGADKIDEIILTASGGPFRNYKKEDLAAITPEDALNHPTWKMGPKITIDSATLGNKGLEVIEAVKLFNMPSDKVKVTIHPQSVVHSMVRLSDGAVYAQLSKPDMRLPIHNALFWPDCRPCEFASIGFDNLHLDFEKPDRDRFPLLNLAYKAASLGALYPTAYNAANETAVEAFINRKISFMQIPDITDYALQYDWQDSADSLHSILEADKKARDAAALFINGVNT
jgi:1-deoxy-D-xylulose-5-phosphate reductoisomerase